MVYTNRFRESATAKRLPEWIRTHKVLATNRKIEKVFPKLGLENCIEDAEHSAVENAKVVFTSDGYTGLWDLATMSMRGALSCMHWQSHHCSHLIGSMVDPFCGIIYITDGSITEYGISMLKRALVRVAVRDHREPFIFIDKIYSVARNKNPLVYHVNRDSHATETYKVFENFLKSKVKIPVYSVGRTLPYSYLHNSFIPQATIVSQLGWNQQSLIDCGIPYGRGVSLPPVLMNSID